MFLLIWNSWSGTVETGGTPVPEPASFLLLTAAVAGVFHCANYWQRFRQYYTNHEQLREKVSYHFPVLEHLVKLRGIFPKRSRVSPHLPKSDPSQSPKAFMNPCSITLPAFLFLLTSCSLPAFKQDAVDSQLLQRHPLPAAQLLSGSNGSYKLNTAPAWLSDVDPSAALTFANLRNSTTDSRYYIVLQVDAAADSLTLAALEPGETPLAALENKSRRHALEEAVASFSPPHRCSGSAECRPLGRAPLKASISDLIAEQRFGPPLPAPRRIFAVAANYPSHLQHDLGLRKQAALRDVLSRARPRVFLKYPVTLPPGAAMDSLKTSYDLFNTILGPFDDIVYPAKVLLPGTKNDRFLEADSRLDYEVEVGIVLHRALNWEAVKDASDEEIREAIAGFVLLSDAKLRNPQVFLRILNDDQTITEDNAYRIGSGLDPYFGLWDAPTAQWWSHAASWGRYTSIGPFFVASVQGKDPARRAMISARSYADEQTRNASLPEGHAADEFYLRQCSTTSELTAEQDGLVWKPAEIIRSILAPDNALSFLGPQRRLEAGDIISLGTPGGAVITSSVSPSLFDKLEDVLFWRTPLDWHNTFFSGKEHLYLRNGDRLFLWAQGLGFQQLRVREARIRG